MNMLPSSSRNDAQDSGFIDSIFPCEIGSGSRSGRCSRSSYSASCPGKFYIGCLNFFNLSERQLVSSSALFLCHVAHIVSHCANKQMTRINTRWIVACVTYAHTFWDRAIKQKPCSAMSINHFLYWLTEKELPVSGFNCVSTPKPATAVSLIRVRQKPLHIGAHNWILSYMRLSGGICA